MNNLVANFDQILSFAKSDQAPIEKKRGIAREYLQTKFISSLYSLPGSDQLSFVGGTSLRMLKGLNRFSEDVDFDNLGLNQAELKKLISRASEVFARENIVVELTDKSVGNKIYFQLKFPRLLYELKISTNPKEKLMIKINPSKKWRGQTTEVILLRRFGLIEQVVTNTVNQLMVQKLTAYVERRRTQPRDIYDVVWLFSGEANLDTQFMRQNKLSSLVSKAKKKLVVEGIPKSFKTRLAPFLFDETQVSKLDLFERVINQLNSK